MAVSEDASEDVLEGVSEDASEDVLEGVLEDVDHTGGCTSGCLVIMS